MQAQFQQVLTKSEIVLDCTLATCSNCLSVIEGSIIEKRKKIFLEKICSICGEKESIIIENDPEFYKKAILPYKINPYLQVGMKRNSAEAKEAMMKESDYVTFCLTSRCNMSCPICYEESQAGKYDETSDVEISDIDKFLMHNKKKGVILTGGEPTLKEDLPQIIRKIIKSGSIPKLCTNGLIFLDKKYIRELKEAGLKFLGLSFDGFKRESSIRLRGQDYVEIKLQIIKNLIEEKMKFWLFAVIKPDENEDQIPEIIKFAANLNKHIEGVRFSPLFIGKNQKETYTTSDILKIIEATCHVESDNYIQTKRFRYNMYQLIGKYLGKNIQENFRCLLSTPIFLKVRKKRIEPLIKTKDLERLNKRLEKLICKKSKIISVFSLIKNMPYLLNMQILNQVFVSLTNNFNFVKASQYGDGILRIVIGNVGGPANEDLNTIQPFIKFSNRITNEHGQV